MLTSDQSQSTALFARLFSSLYINPPGLEILQELAQQDLAGQWPFADDQQSVEILNDLRNELSQTDNFFLLQRTLQEEHLILFIGVGMPLVPLWGSVYLDEENLLLGPSCLKLEAFLAQADLACILNAREPLDHLGLILSALAVFLERIHKDGGNNEDVLLIIKDLLEKHINPWIYRCLKLQSKEAQSFFYQALGQLTQNLFVHLSEKFHAQRIKTKLYY